MEVTREVELQAPLDEVWRADGPGRLEEWFANDVELDLGPAARAASAGTTARSGRRSSRRSSRSGASCSRWDESPSRSSSSRSTAGTRVGVTETGGRRLGHRARAAGARVRPRVTDVFAALADPTPAPPRSRRSPSGRRRRRELAAELPVTRQAVAKHLAALRDAGLVDAAARAARRATG